MRRSNPSPAPLTGPLLTGGCARPDQHQPFSAKVISWLVWLSIVFSLISSALFFWAWYAFYFSIEFNQMGRYFDEENSVVYTDDGVVWIIPAIGFLLLAVVMLAWRLWRRRSSGSRP